MPQRSYAGSARSGLERCPAGRRQERLARRDVPRAGAPGRARAERVRHHGGCATGTSCTPPAWQPTVDTATSTGSTPRDLAELAERGLAIRQAIVARAHCPTICGRRSSPPTTGSASGAADRRGRAQQRHGRGPARRQLRRPAGNVSQRARPRRAARRLPPLLRVAVHRPGDLLPRRQGLRSAADRALDRRAAHGPLGPGDVGRDVHARHRDRLPRRRADQRARTASARPSCRAR